MENDGVIITTSQATSVQDMNIIKKYVKKTNNINFKYIDISWLYKSKSYSKILGFSYILENTNLLITSELAERVIKETYIFNDIILIFKPYIINISSKFDLAIV